MEFIFTMPGILPSSSPVEVPVPSGIPAVLNGGVDVTGKAVIELGFNLLFAAAAVIAVVMLIFAGIAWITSGGDPAQVSAAKKRMTYSIVGLVVVSLAFVIVSLIYSSLTGHQNQFLKLGN